MIKYLLWADDLVIFATSAEALQLQLKHLENYCKKWKVQITSGHSCNVVRTGAYLYGTDVCGFAAIVILYIRPPAPSRLFSNSVNLIMQ
jgi:hypothetical protein